MAPVRPGAVGCSRRSRRGFRWSRSPCPCGERWGTSATTCPRSGVPASLFPTRITAGGDAETLHHGDAEKMLVQWDRGKNASSVLRWRCLGCKSLPTGSTGTPSPRGHRWVSCVSHPGPLGKGFCHLLARLLSRHPCGPGSATSGGWRPRPPGCLRPEALQQPPAGAAPAPCEGREAAPHAASRSAPRHWGRRVLPPSLASPTGLRPCPPFRAGKPKRHVFFFSLVYFFFLPIIRAFLRPRRAPRCNSVARDLADPRLNFQRKQVITAEKPRLCEA